jgi:hypothetical protein
MPLRMRVHDRGPLGAPLRRFMKPLNAAASPRSSASASPTRSPARPGGAPRCASRALPERARCKAASGRLAEVLRPHGVTKDKEPSHPHILVAGAWRRWSRLNWSHILWWGIIQTGVLLAPFTFSWSALIVCAALYLAAGFGVTMGYHRLLTGRRPWLTCAGFRAAGTRITPDRGRRAAAPDGGPAAGTLRRSRN